METTDTVQFQCSESVITCQICMEIFNSPRILPCQHTFCKECVISLLKRHCLDEEGNRKNDSFPCPNCRRECKIRQKGERSIEEHLKCFPESLLLKTFLDSRVENSSEKTRAELNGGTEIQDEKLVHDTPDDQGYGNRVCITRQAENAIVERLWFYCLFLRKLQDFVTFVQKSYSGSIRKARRPTFEILVKGLIEIPFIKTNLFAYIRQSTIYFPRSDIKTSLAQSDSLEGNIRTTIENMIQNDDQEDGYSHVQTQTENSYTLTTVYDVLKYQFYIFFLATLKGYTCSVFCLLDRYLFNTIPGFKRLECNLHDMILLRRIMYWMLAFKLYDVIFVSYTAGISFYWPLLLCTTSYVLFILCFQKIKKYIGGRMYIDVKLLLLPILITSLNVYSNINRGYVYCSAIIHIQFWLFIKLVLTKLVPEFVLFLVQMACRCRGKEHYYYQYGPIVKLNSMQPEFQGLFPYD